MKKLIIIGSCFAALGVIFGAFAAHTLQPVMTSTQAHSFETGVKYQLIHSLAILLMAILYKISSQQIFKYSAYLFTAGILLFSFSLYLLSLKQLFGISSWTFLGPITPIGGLLFICGWISTVWATIKMKNV